MIPLCLCLCSLALPLPAYVHDPLSPLVVAIRTVIVDVAREEYEFAAPLGGRHPSTVIATPLSVIEYLTSFVAKGSK